MAATGDTTQGDLLAAVREYLLASLTKGRPIDERDLAVWNRFYRTYNEILVSFAIRLKFRSQEIEDLVQDVWHEVIKALPHLEYREELGGFRRWLFTIVRRRAIDHARRRRRQVPLESSMLARAANGADDDLDRAFHSEIVAKAIEQFRGRARAEDWRIFELCRLEEKSSSQAGETLGISAEAARKRLERAMREFRRHLAELVGSSQSAG